MSVDVEKFLHTRRLPHIWCPGCGIGMVTGAFLRVMIELDLTREKTVVVGGIGCSSRATGYLDLNTVHTLHGRALAFATGIKMCRPDFTVVVFTGDGDGAAIGGNHLIHACRRNIDITCILFNNHVYGMTGGQLSPTMNIGNKATTAPYGQVEPPFDLCALGRVCGRQLRRPGHGRSHPADGEADSRRHRTHGFLLYRSHGPLPHRIWPPQSAGQRAGDARCAEGALHLEVQG